MELKEIQNRISAMDEALIAKGYVSPDCDLTIQGSGDVDVWVKTARSGEISGMFEGISAESIEEAFDRADEFIEQAESVYLYKKRQAVKQFGRAIDGLRDADIEADFVDPLAESLKAMTENLLTYQKDPAQ